MRRPLVAGVVVVVGGGRGVVAAAAEGGAVDAVAVADAGRDWIFDRQQHDATKRAR